jgi:hypothetical protein
MLQQLLLIGAGPLVQAQPHHRTVVEQVAHAAGSPEAAAVFAEGQAQLGGGAVAVVGEGLDQHGDATRAIALVAHLLEWLLAIPLTLA